jgi:hypothetical protein
MKKNKKNPKKLREELVEIQSLEPVVAPQSGFRY